MKKILLCILCMVILFFLIPIIFTKKNKIIDVINKEDNTYINTPYNYGDLSTVKLLHVKTGEIEELDLDTYLL